MRIGRPSTLWRDDIVMKYEAMGWQRNAQNSLDDDDDDDDDSGLKSEQACLSSSQHSLNLVLLKLYFTNVKHLTVQ